MTNHLDELVLRDADSYDTTRLDGDLPYVVSGFSASVETSRTHLAADVRGWDATGVVDDEWVFRGLVDKVQFGTDHERVTLTVRPPDPSEFHTPEQIDRR